METARVQITYFAPLATPHKDGKVWFGVFAENAYDVQFKVAPDLSSFELKGRWMEEKYSKYVHETPYGYVVAHFDKTSGQWRTSDVPEFGGARYCFTYSWSLAGLWTRGARTYKHKADAVKVADEVYFIE